MSSEEHHAVTLHTEGPNLHGDLRVTGFASLHTAQQIAAEFADALRRRYPGATVYASFENEPCTRCTSLAGNSHRKGTKP